MLNIYYSHEKYQEYFIYVGYLFDVLNNYKILFVELKT